MPRRKAAPRMTAAEARAIDAEVDRAVRRARSSAKAYQKKRNAAGFQTSTQAATRRGSKGRLAAYYAAFPGARRSRNVARHLQGLQGASGGAVARAKKRGHTAPGIMGLAQIPGAALLMGKAHIERPRRARKVAAPKAVRRVVKRVARRRRAKA